MVTNEYVAGDIWIAKGYHPYTGEYCEFPENYYDDETIYFAIKVGWDDDV